MDVEKCDVVARNENKGNPVSFQRKWGEEGLPIVDQYTYIGVEISKDCSWDAHNSYWKGENTCKQDRCDPNRPTRTLTRVLRGLTP